MKIDMANRTQHDQVIEPERWSKDHWSTLLYVETCVVDQAGKLKAIHLRSDGVKYPTRLTDCQLAGHNDWDCLEDMEKAGLLINKGTGYNPIYDLTDEGWKLAGLCRRWKAEDKGFINFRIEAIEAIEDGDWKGEP